MKLQKWLMVAAPLTLSLSTLPIALTSCGQSETDKTPLITDVKAKGYQYYNLQKQKDGSYKYGEFGVDTSYGKYFPSVKITYFNGQNIPYVDLDEYINSISNFYCKTANNITVINSLYNKEWCLIDYKKQTITFSDWDGFVDFNQNSKGHLARGAGGGENYFKDVIEIKYYRGEHQTIDLSNYHIKAYYYNDPNVNEYHGYLPYELVRNLLNINLWMNCDFNGSGMYQIVPGNNEISLLAKKQVKEAGDLYSKEDYRIYCYNLLALTLDARFGLIQRQSRANPGTTISYLPSGAYEALSEYYYDLISTSDDVSNNALLSLFTTKLDDGGHARYVNLNAFSTKNYATDAEKGAETRHTFQIMNGMSNARKEKGLDIYTKTGTKAEDNIACGYIDTYNGSTEAEGNIAYITFDSFKSAYDPDAAPEGYKWTQEEIDAKRELPTSTTKDNYYSDTLRLTMYANKLIKDPANNIKNVVVDLSANGGGAVYTEHFIASWLLGGVTEKIYNPKTGAYSEYMVRADINGDGEFNSDDYITDVNLYVITSSSSFSCGNMLPCNVADCAGQRTAKTILMGTKSGGGACFVDDGLYIGTNTYYRSSSTFHMLRNKSSYKKYYTVDDGAEITSGWEMKDTNPSLFVDRQTIVNRIWGR